MGRSRDPVGLVLPATMMAATDLVLIAASIAPACAPSTARAPCAAIDLQCTGRNQPSRISCAIPRASLRSFLTGIARKASRTWRVSNSSTGSPAARIAAYSHCDSGPASRPIRSSSQPSPRNQAISASGSLGTFDEFARRQRARGPHQCRRDCIQQRPLPSQPLHPLERRGTTGFDQIGPTDKKCSSG